MSSNNGWPIWKIVILLVLVLVVSFTTLGVMSCFGGFAQEGVDVAQKEVGPAALLKKYEWFKDASAQLDKKQADVKVYQRRITAMDGTYNGTLRKDWPRTDLEQYNVWTSEVAGVKASYNGLAADYNAQMAKANWVFANKGTLPQGADQPLPREYKPYIEN